MTRIFRQIAILLAIITSLQLNAITLDQCKALARDNYPLLRAYNVIALTEQFSLEAASRAWLPQLQVGAMAAWQNNVATYPDLLMQMLKHQGIDAKGMAHHQVRASVDLQQTIYDGGQIHARKEIAKAQAEESRKSYDVELYDLDHRIEEIFFGILLLDEQAKTIGTSIALLEANCQLMANCHKHGVATTADIDAISAELLTARQQLDNINATKSNYSNILALYIGVDQCPALEMPQHLETTGGQRPELSLFDAQKATIDSRRKEINASMRPTIALFGTGFYGYPGFNSMEAIISRSWSWNMQIGLKVAWNISPLYSRKANLGTLDAMEKQIDIRRDTFIFNQRLQSLTQHSELSRLQRITRHDDQILALRTRVRQAEEAKLREGVVNTTDLLRKLSDEQTAAITASMHKIETLKTEQELKHILGL